MRKLIAIFLVIVSTKLPAEVELGEWLEINEPKVVSFLLSLTENDRGKELSGLELSHDMIEFEGYVYLGNIVDGENRSHIYLFDAGEYGYVAYIWVEDGGVKLEIPDCDVSHPLSHFPGWGGAIISGDVYTYNDVIPGGNVVSTHCIPQSWKEKVTHNKPLETTSALLHLFVLAEPYKPRGVCI